MKITLLGEDVIRLEPVAGPMTIEAASSEMIYSPYHMLASALATCTFSVMSSWASHRKVSVDDLAIEVHWRFGDNPHRVSNYGVIFDWPSLPADRLATAKRVAALCSVHATLQHAPVVDILAAAEMADHHHDAASEGDSAPAVQAAAPEIVSP